MKKSIIFIIVLTIACLTITIKVARSTTEGNILFPGIEINNLPIVPINYSLLDNVVSNNMTWKSKMITSDTHVSLSYTSGLILYKQVDSVKLFLEVYYPNPFDTAGRYPAMVFFFGGGWVQGDRNHFKHHAEYFSKRGLICILTDYRTKEKHGTTPFESLKDAKSAIRFIRGKANELGVDSEKIIASGGSAGGHLAAATALIDKYDESSDDLSISSIPDALVLFNPVIDNGPGGFGNEKIGDAYKDFSPLHNIKAGAPPTILFLGTEDELVPVITARYYKLVMEKVGSRCDLKLYEGGSHGFFNYRFFENYKSTVLQADEFLQSLGYLEKEPFIEIKNKP